MLPFYGDPTQFMTAVKSVLAQDNPDWRLVIIDDQYPDPAPGEWAAAIEDPRVTYRRNTKNLRISGNFNESIRLMENSHAIILGCDDILLPGFVGRALELIERFPDAALIQPGVEIIDGEDHVYSPLADRIKAMCRPSGSGTREVGGEELVTSLLRGNWLYFPSLIWRVSELKSRAFRTDLEVVQDLDMILSIIEADNTLVIDEQTVFQYRRHAQSLSAKRGPDGKKFIEERAVFDAAASRAKARGWRRAARAASLRLTSRANALTELPAALRAGSGASTRSLLRHVFGG